MAQSHVYRENTGEEEERDGVMLCKGGHTKDCKQIARCQGERHGTDSSRSPQMDPILPMPWSQTLASTTIKQFLWYFVIAVPANSQRGFEKRFRGVTRLWSNFYFFHCVDWFSGPVGAFFS